MVADEMAAQDVDNQSAQDEDNKSAQDADYQTAQEGRREEQHLQDHHLKCSSHLTCHEGKMDGTCGNQEDSLKNAE